MRGLRLLKTYTYYYCTIAQGEKRIYTNADGLTEYGLYGILDPQRVSYINLFINGVLQPSSLYGVRKGVLFLKSNNLPQTGEPIVLQFIVMYQESPLKKRRTIKRGKSKNRRPTNRKPSHRRKHSKKRIKKRKK